MSHPGLAILHAACSKTGLPVADPVLLRDGENLIWLATPGVVVRIGRPGQSQAVAREVHIAQWLADNDFPAVRLMAGVAQPVEVAGRPVTFWQALPPHRPGTVADVAQLLRTLHSLPPPTGFDPGRLEPFVRLQERITECTIIDPSDRDWLLAHLSGLEAQWRRLPSGMPACVVHGDAWVGNVAVDAAGRPVMLDLERSAVGPPEWDLVSTAIKVTSFGWVPEAEYLRFVAVYGADVTSWAGFPLMRDIREVRMATYLLQQAEHRYDLVPGARFRVDCLRGRAGPRPWPWHPTG